MQTAITYLIGKHDFKSFQAAGTAVQQPYRTVNFCSLETGPEIKLMINADGISLSYGSKYSRHAYYNWTR